MNFSALILLCLVGGIAGGCPGKKTATKLICYYSKLVHVDPCKCSHVVLPADSDVKNIDRVREQGKGVKILITVNEFNQGLVDILKSSKVDGIEINLKKLDSKNDINDFISTVRSRLGSDLQIVISVPAKTETLAKYYDFKTLSKNADLFILQTAFLGASKNVTFHPSRLSGLWDMQNTDSVVDLVSGLGAPLSKLVITSPVQAFKFKLQSEKHTAPGSPALEIQSITRDELCEVMKNGKNWTLERDQDQTGPYIFSKEQWIAFDDATSIDIKAKYTRIRGLAGMALKDLSQDGAKCESSLLDAAYQGLSRQARAPRGAVLHSLEREILETPARPLDTVQVSPYRISRVIDVEGSVHVIRKDTRTEFECSRQGYFVHPRSCGRFYRCVKFDQLSDEFSVFEFDCPAGLAFDSRVEVCVWPGSLPHASPCSGSSEIAPVPRERFICPQEPGYYADPENCRWFFACLDHGKSPLSAYEFRCPFGLVYDESRLLCEWPWLVPKCGSGYAVASQVVYGGSAVAIDQYDGLGTLGVTTLGGLHGPLQQPQAKVYSNVGLVSQGDQYLTGQLSLQAAQSLQHAGLLRTGNANLQGVAVGYSSGAINDKLAIKTTQAEGLGLGYTNGVASSSFGANLGYQTGSLSGSVSSGYAGSGSVSSGYAGSGTASSGYVGSGSISSGYAGSGTASTGYVGSGLASSGYAGTGTISTGYVGTTNAHLVNGLADDLSLKNAQVEYHGNAGSNYDAGTSGNINIVGGGYSAVGVQVSNYGEDSNIVSHVTQSPISVSTVSSIPAVTAVPVPALNVASGFESYKGGVVANVPELQYRVASRGNFGFKNVSNSFVNFVSSTPATVVTSGYQYPKPTVAFVEEPIKSTLSTGTSFVQHNVASIQPVVSTSVPIVQKVVQPVVTTYQQPISIVKQQVQPVVTTYQKPVSIIEQRVQPVVTTYRKPVVVSTTQTPVVVQKLNIQPVVKETFVGYDYPKPAVRFEETPVKATGFSYVDIAHSGPSTVKPIVQQVHVQQPVVSVQPQLEVTSYNVPSSTPRPVVQQVPQVYVSSTPATVPVVQQQAVSFTNFQKHETIQPQVVQQKVVQPAVVSSFSISSNSEGYHYDKPSIAFEEKPVVTYQQNIQPKLQVSYNIPSSTIKPVVVKQPAVTFTNFQQHIVQPQLQVTSYNVPASTPKPVVFEQTPQVYVSSTPASVPVVQQQAVSFTNYQKHETVQPQVVQKVLQPAVVTPVIQQKVVQPAVVSSFSISSNNGGYHYDKPSVAFEERPVTYQQAAVQKTVVQPVSTYSYQQPVSTYTYKQPVSTYTYKQPVSTYAYKQPVSTYSYKNVLQTTVNQGYTYPKPAIAFEEVPAGVTRLNQKPAVISSYNHVAPTPVKQAVVLQKQTPVVTSYTYTAPSTVKPAVVLQNQAPVVSSYTYTAPVKPAVVLQKEQPVVTSYTYTAPSTVKPAVVLQQQPVVTSYYTPSTVRPAVVLQKQAPVVSSYTYTAPSTIKPTVLVQQPVVSSYVEASTPKTAIFLQKQPVSTVTYTPKPVVLKKQPAVVSSYSFSAQPVKQEFTGYDYPKPSISFVEQPRPVITYDNRQPVEEVPFVKKKAYVTGGQSYQYAQQYKPVIVENYQAPVVVSSTTPKYQQYSVDSGYVYEKPVVPFEEVPASRTREYYVESRPQVVSTTSRPVVNYEYVQSTPKPTFSSTVKAIIAAKQPWTYYDSRLTSTLRPVAYSTELPVVQTVTTSRPVSQYSFGVDERYQEINDYVVPLEVTSPRVKVDYVPIKVTTPRVKVDYVPQVKVATVTTSRPIAKYSFSSLDEQYQPNAKIVENYVAPVEVTPPSREYLPVTTSAPVKYTSTPAVTREYLPPRTRVVTTTPAREYLPVKVAPTREYLPAKTRVRVGTIDDEVVSRRPVKIVRVSRPKTIVKVNDFRPLLSAKLGAQCTCMSNTVRLRKKPLRIIVEEDDDDDDGYVVDNDSTVVENYEYEPQKIVEITPTPEVYIKSTEIAPTPEVFVKSTVPSLPPAYTRKRVRVRPVTSTQAPVLSEASQDTVVVNSVSNEAVSNLQSAKFDRYGPGGWRSRDETLQGTIDCQRAGLFRHPTQCNKFYACRWDCTKNRYTLHVFNCPVHLTFDNNLGACNWPSQGPACLENTLLPSD